jgi:hypothetical protein
MTYGIFVGLKKTAFDAAESFAIVLVVSFFLLKKQERGK